MEKVTWNGRVKAAGGDFMQSTEWGAFHTALGWRVEQVDAGGLFAHVVFRPLPLGANQGYVPMGPLLEGHQARGFARGLVDASAFSLALRNAADRRTLFLEYDLLEPVPALGTVTPHTRQPLRTHLVDIAGKNADTLYAAFHPTLQQNLSRAERHSLVVRKEEGWRPFYKLYTHTTERHDIRAWHEGYIRTLWETLAPQGMVEIWGVYHEGELLSSNMYVIWEGRATHLFAGSSERKREMMAPHLLHWRMMSHYAERGIHHYDLGKVDRQKLPGLTTFKTRFGGTTHVYPGNVKNILHPLCYRLYTTLKSLR